MIIFNEAVKANIIYSIPPDRKLQIPDGFVQEKRKSTPKRKEVEERYNRDGRQEYGRKSRYDSRNGVRNHSRRENNRTDRRRFYQNLNKNFSSHGGRKSKIPEATITKLPNRKIKDMTLSKLKEELHKSKTELQERERRLKNKKLKNSPKKAAENHQRSEILNVAPNHQILLMDIPKEEEDELNRIYAEALGTPVSPRSPTPPYPIDNVCKCSICQDRTWKINPTQKTQKKNPQN